MTKKDFMKECAEIWICRKMMAIFLFLYFIMAFFTAIMALEDVNVFFSMLLLFTIVFGSVIAYYLYRMIHIIRNFRNDDFIIAEFREMHKGWSRNLYFTVNFVYNGEKKEADTRSIFSASIFDWIYLDFEEYANKKVLIAYNRISEEIVVVHPVED